MDETIHPEQIVGTWAHSHEEDVPGRTIFRHGDFKFPPSRGRRSLEFLQNGEVREGRPGPDDRRQWNVGSWTLHGRRLNIQFPGRPEEIFDIDDIDSGRIAVHRD